LELAYRTINALTTENATMKRSDFRYFQTLRVRWVEVDMQKIVFNGHYLMYFDTAIGGYWQRLGMPYAQSMERMDGDIFVKKASIEFHASAEYDDRLDVALRCEHVGNSSMVFQGAIFRGDTCLVTGELVYVFANPEAKTSKPVPTPLRQALADFEAGHTVVTMRQGNWVQLGEDASAVRGEVFVKEQGISRDDEWDEMDPQSVHAVAYNFLNMPLATGRLLPAEEGVAKIGRMAVLRAVRGTGYGADVLRTLMAVARARGDRQVMLHAQRSAEGFYQRLGFTVHGQPFDEVGIEHVTMVCSL
jgi:YbgC/YbaW family acyl-CoA thioester hydrolase